MIAEKRKFIQLDALYDNDRCFVGAADGTPQAEPEQ